MWIIFQTQKGVECFFIPFNKCHKKNFSRKAIEFGYIKYEVKGEGVHKGGCNLFLSC